MAGVPVRRLMLVHIIYMTYLYCMFVLVIFSWTSKILPEMKTFSEKNGQKEFPTPLAGIADQVLPLKVAFFCFYFFQKL